MNSDQRVGYGFWTALTQTGGCALIREWRQASGGDWPLVEPWLGPTDQVAEVCLCPSEPPCQCAHELVETRHGWVARCVCEPVACAPVPISPADRMLWEWDVPALEKQIAAALGLSRNCERDCEPSFSSLHLAGRLSSGGPVYLSLHSTRGWKGEWLGVLLREPDAIVLCPGPSESPRSVSLSSLLRPGRDRGFTGPHDPVEKCLPGPVQAAGPTARVLEELRRELSRLRKTTPPAPQVQGGVRELGHQLSVFTGKIEPRSFQVLCAVLAAGDVAKASRQLKIPDATVRSVIKGWRGRGPAYETMRDLVRWRKQVGRRETVRLNEAIFATQTPSTDYAGLLSDVLEHLLEMTEDNWEERSQELAALLRPYTKGSVL